MNACCTGWSAGGFRSPFCFAYHAGSPSSVVIDLPARDPTGVTHEPVSTPFTRTEQEPHCASPHPNRGPCRSNSFERTYNRGVSGLDVTGHKRSFTLILSAAAIWKCPPLGSSCDCECYTVWLARCNPIYRVRRATWCSRRILWCARFQEGICSSLQCQPEG